MTALVLRGDARCLPLPDGSVDLIVTSPPYFALRSYTDGGEHYPGQIGSEDSPVLWLRALLEATREWVRVLKPAGSIWVNLGDKYAQNEERSRNGNGNRQRTENVAVSVLGPTLSLGRRENGVRTKSLMGLPWRYALACIDDLGLILRAEVIWSKPNGLPEPVQDRVRRSHEQWFHFVTQPRYFAGVDEIREPHSGKSHSGRKDGAGSPFHDRVVTAGQRGGAMPGTDPGRFDLRGRLPGSVWTVASEPLTVPRELGVDHFAAFPTELPRRIIAGWSPTGICQICGGPLRPDVDVEYLSSGDTFRGGDPISGRHRSGSRMGDGIHVRVTGYSCACPEPGPLAPAVVLDPFGGTGTTALVASVLGRTGVSVDLSADYCRLGVWRTTDPGQRAKALRVAAPPPVLDGQASLFE